MNVPVLLVGNFLSGCGGSRGVCEELAIRLSALGGAIFTTSDKPARIPRLLDMLCTVHRQRARYAVAQVDVYSGPAFIWAETVCAWLRRLRKPYVLTLHGGNLPAFAKRNRRRVRRLLASARVVTTPSRFMLEQMREHRADLRLIPNALELDRYPFKLRERVAPSLMWLRAFHEIYNPALAPRVMKLLMGRFPQGRLTMIGPDKRDESLRGTRTIAANLGVSEAIHFPGAVAKEQVPAWLGQGDIFLNTTNVDNIPVSVLEAMACGLCTVSTNVGGLPYFLETERHALLVPPNDPEAMASAVHRLLVEPGLARRISENGRARAQEHDWSIVLPQWRDLFHEIALQKGKGFADGPP